MVTIKLTEEQLDSIIKGWCYDSLDCPHHRGFKDTFGGAKCDANSVFNEIKTGLQQAIEYVKENKHD